MINAVVFDVGECLVDETREYGTWADWLGVPRHTFSSMFGAVIAQGRDYREVFQHFQPGFDLGDARKQRAAQGVPEFFDHTDLYPDVYESLATLTQMSLWVGVAGNQTERAGEILRSLDLPANAIVTSDDLGVEKPNKRFFEKIAELADVRYESIVYVGDRLDNDVKPAAELDMKTALIRRGPWATIQWDTSEALSVPTMRINSLAELPSLIEELNSASQ